MIYLSQYSGQLGKCYIQLKKHIGLRDLRRASATCARDGGENPIAALTNGLDSSPNRRDSSPNRRDTFTYRRESYPNRSNSHYNIRVTQYTHVTHIKN